MQPTEPFRLATVLISFSPGSVCTAGISGMNSNVSFPQRVHCVYLKTVRVFLDHVVGLHPTESASSTNDDAILRIQRSETLMHCLASKPHFIKDIAHSRHVEMASNPPEPFQVATLSGTAPAIGTQPPVVAPSPCRLDSR